MDWIRRFILFHGKQHPADMGLREVEGFLSYLALERHVSAATQNQAKAAILFLYKRVLGSELPWLDGIVQAQPSRRLPVVLSPGEVRRLLDQMRGVTGLVARLLLHPCAEPRGTRGHQPSGPALNGYQSRTVPSMPAGSKAALRAAPAAFWALLV